MTTPSAGSTPSCTTCNLTEICNNLMHLPLHERELRVRRYLYAKNRKDDWDSLLMGNAVAIDLEQLQRYGVALSEASRKFILATANPANIGKDSYVICQELDINLDDIIAESVTQPYKDFALEIHHEHLDDLMFRTKQSFLRAMIIMVKDNPTQAFDYMHRFAHDKVLPALMSPDQNGYGKGSQDGEIREAQWSITDSEATE